MSIRLALCIAACAGLTFASVSASGKTLLAEGGKSSGGALAATHSGGAIPGAKTDSQRPLSDAQMDKVTAGLGFDSSGYRAALNVWLLGVEGVLSTYTGAETHLPLLTGCSGSGLTGGVCTSGTPPPDPLPFFK